jgi:hypothetical protein
MRKEPVRVGKKKNYYIFAERAAEIELGLVRLERSGELKAKGASGLQSKLHG